MSNTHCHGGMGLPHYPREIWPKIGEKNVSKISNAIFVAELVPHPHGRGVYFCEEVCSQTQHLWH